MTLLVFFLRGGGLVSSSLFAIKTGFTAQEPQFYRGKHEVDRRSRLVTLKYKGYCWSGCYTVAESVGQQSFNSALGMLNNNIPGGGAAYTGHIACFKSGLASTPMLSIPSLGVNSWSYCEAPVTLSVLVDMVRGCATFGLNGLAGPCVRFPGEGWRNGVHVQARGFPVPAVLEGARCILSCATPPTPPAILAAASHPMTVVEHLAAGSLCEEANVIIPN